MAIELLQSRKALFAIVLLVAVLLCSVAVAYGEVTVGSVAPLKGAVTYSLDNTQIGTWNTTLAPNGPLAPWYSRLEITSAGYSGHVTVSWKLQKETGLFSWTDVPGAAMLTSMELSGNVRIIYATSDGVYGSSNFDWGQNVAASGTYRIVATVTA